MLFVFFNFASTPGAFRTYFTFVSCIRVLHPHAALHPRRRWQRPHGLPCLSYQPLCSMPPQMAVWVPPIPPDWRRDDCSLFPADPSIVKPGHTVVLSVSVFARTQRCQRASAFCIQPPFCIHRFYVLTTVSSLRTKRASTICIHTPFCILVRIVAKGIYPNRLKGPRCPHRHPCATMANNLARASRTPQSHPCARWPRWWRVGACRLLL